MRNAKRPPRVVFAALLLAVPAVALGQQPAQTSAFLNDLLRPQQVAAPPSPSAARAPVLVADVAHSFLPTQRFAGTDLAGWTMHGGEWRAQGGEYLGTLRQAATGALLLDRAYQDLAVTATFRCGAGCRPGILVRAETEGDRTTGVLYSFDGRESASYAVTFDSRGRELERRKLASAISPYDIPKMLGFRAEFPGLANLNPAELGAQPAVGVVRTDGGWNHVEIYVIGNTIRAVLNGGGLPDGDLTGVGRRGFGKVGLYLSGEAGAEVRFRELGIKPMDIRGADPREVTAPRFEKLQLEGMFYSEAVTAADVDLDGNLDVIAGPYVYLGPGFLTRREIYVPQVYSAHAYPDPLLASAGEYTGDGYPDILYTGEPGRPGFLYVNPGKEDRRWDKYMVIPSVDNEVAFLDDIDGDGKAEYIYGDGGFLGYAKPGADPTKMWTFQPVTEKGPWGAMYAHGLGTGDINGDGRKDLVQGYGWWEQPASGPAGPWTYHPQTFGRWGPQQGGGGGARAYVYDVNGDGLNDVVTSLEAHGWGLAWFEQKKVNGAISFERHMIMDDFSAPADGVAFAALHALTLADVDGDGLLDIITGKRWWGHFGENPTDPDATGAPVLYWFRLVRSGGQVHYVPELINNNSGVGTDMIAADLNKDGLADVMTSTRRGTMVFLSKGRGPAR
jgi:hypothetical protein